MTTDKTSHETDAAKDPDVSRLYREVATESPPASLDRAVMEHARRQATAPSYDRYQRSIHWLRPMAWAATVVLCLAIVVDSLQMASEPAIEAVGIEPFEARSPEVVTPMDELEQLKKEKADGNFAAPAASPSMSYEVLRQDVDADAFRPEDAPLTEAVEEKAAAQSPAEDEAPLAADEAPLADSPSVSVDAAPMRAVAPALPSGAAAPASGRMRELDETASSAFADSEALEAACRDEQRRVPETWLECIEELEHRGLDDVAAREREQFEATWPDFESP